MTQPQNTGILICTLLIFSALASCKSMAATEEGPDRFSFYSESVYQGKFSAVTQSSRFQASAWRPVPGIEFYGGMHLDQQLAARLGDRVTEDFVAAYPGLQFVPIGWPIGIAYEYWRVLGKTERPQEDHRGIAWFYREAYLPPIALSRHLFSETYAESVFSSRQGNELTFSGWSKLGHRIRLGPDFRLDAFLEASLKRDRLRYREENLQQVGPGARFTAVFQPIAASLSATYGIGVYALAPGAGYREVRGLLVLSGSF